MKKITFLKTLFLILIIASTANARFVSTLAGSGAAGSANNTVGALSTFFNPGGICNDNNGNLYVVDHKNHRIRKIVIATGAVSTFAGGGGNGSGSADNANGLLATFRYPNGICFDGVGSLYVSDTESYKIRKINIATTAVTTVAGSGTAAYQDGTGTGASFDFPDGICFDNGNLYVEDEYIHLIRKIVIATGEVSTFAGSGVGSSNDGIGTAATFNTPIGICTDGNGNLYVTEILGHKLRKISIATKQVTTVAGASTGGYADGTSANASFFGPVGICYDGNGSLFLVDLGNYAIRQIVIATGEVTTFAGSGNMGSANGTGIDASFNDPHSITYYNSNFYVTDSANHKIRKITSSILNNATFDKEDTIDVYPNPSTGIYNIDVNGDVTIEIFDIVGKQLRSQKISTGANQLDLTQYNAGVYFAKVTNNLNQSKTIKIIKQ